jgi:hypothetical protein
MYFPGLGEADITPVGGLSAGTQALMNTRLAAWLNQIAAVVTGVQQMVILHSLGITATPDPTPVTSMTVDPIVATQRRRLRK